MHVHAGFGLFPLPSSLFPSSLFVIFPLPPPRLSLSRSLLLPISGNAQHNAITQWWVCLAPQVPKSFNGIHSPSSRPSAGLQTVSVDGLDSMAFHVSIVGLALCVIPCATSGFVSPACWCRCQWLVFCVRCWCWRSRSRWCDWCYCSSCCSFWTVELTMFVCMILRAWLLHGRCVKAVRLFDQACVVGYRSSVPCIRGVEVLFRIPAFPVCNVWRYPDSSGSGTCPF